MPEAATHVTLVEAAALLWPYAKGHSGYDRLRRIIERHRRTCPVKFSHGPSPANGRPARYLARTDLPTLKQWVEGF